MSNITSLKKLLSGPAAPSSGVVISYTSGKVTLATTQGSQEFPYSGIQPQIGQTLSLKDGEAVAIILRRNLPDIHHL
jgi:adenosylcobinamide amidohydrolase